MQTNRDAIENNKVLFAASQKIWNMDRLKNNPEVLDNLTIQCLGQNYLEAHDASKKSCFPRFFDKLFHTNHSVATKLSNYNVSSDSYEKWFFLAECYGGLIKNNGELSTAIINLFDLAFNKGIFAYKLVHSASKINSSREAEDNFSAQALSDALKMLIADYYIKDLRKTHATHHHHNIKISFLLKGIPDTLSNSLIQKMGEGYLSKYPIDKSTCLGDCFAQHPDYVVAAKLQSYTLSSDCYEKWLFLAEAYKELSESKGELSNQILSAFLTAFGKTPYTHELSYKSNRFGGFFYSSYYSPALISISLKGIVNEHYANQYRFEQVHYCQPTLVGR